MYTQVAILQTHSHYNNKGMLSKHVPNNYPREIRGIFFNGFESGGGGGGGGAMDIMFNLQLKYFFGVILLAQP